MRWAMLVYISLMTVGCAYSDLKAPCTDGFTNSFNKEPCGKKKSINSDAWQ